MIQLGQKVRDEITGFEGVVTARVEYINGCVQFAVQPTTTDEGKMPDPVYLDHQRLEVIDPVPKGVPKAPLQAVGGPQRETPSGTYRG